MKTKAVSILLLAGLAFGPLAFAENDQEHNLKLHDVMYLMSDQVAGVGDLAKAPPAGVKDEVFARALTRTRGAVYLFDLIKEKQGTIEGGKLVADELTPGKLLALQGQELVTALAKYDEMLEAMKGRFTKLGAEIEAQSTKAPAARDFKELRRQFLELEPAKKSAHEFIKPQP